MLLGNVIFSEQAQEKFHALLGDSKLLEKVFAHDIKVSEILQIETKYHSQIFGQTWMLCRCEPHSTYYCVLTRDDENTAWRLVWLGTAYKFIPLLRHIFAECINEVYLDVGPVTFYIG